MIKPDFITSEQWKTILSFSALYNANPILIAAIGLHETGWGKLGWGKEGYILGVGCFSETQADSAMIGFDTQIQWACNALGLFFGIHPSLDELKQFAGKIWKPQAPDLWAKSVFEIFQKLLPHYAPDLKDFDDIPDFARESVNYLLNNNFINNPFGTMDFYRSMTVIHRIYTALKSHITL